MALIPVISPEKYLLLQLSTMKINYGFIRTPCNTVDLSHSSHATNIVTATYKILALLLN